MAALATPCLVSGQTVDTFYERLYQDGLRSMSLGNHAAAAKDLRLACFGMLERTDRLGDCLARLALAEAEAGDKEAFLRTTTRLIEVEQQFQGYTRSALPQAERQRLEARLEQWAPLESYAGVTAFKSIAERRRAERIRGQPAAQRQQELDRAIAQDPGNPLWRILQVEMLLEQGRSTEAAEIADRLASTYSADSRVTCVRGRAQVGVGACDPKTLADLQRCDAVEHRADALEATLRCHIQNSDWDAASEVLAVMEPGQRQERQVRALAKEVKRGRRNQPTEAPPALETAEPVESVEPPAATAGSSAPGRVEQEILESGWEILHSDARDRFEDTYDSVRSIANRYPTWTDAQHLSAELAYRLSLWDDAVSYFRRAEEIVSQKPNLQFYLAVALYKSGDQEAAAAMLDQCVPHIQASDFVQFWVERIRNSTG